MIASHTFIEAAKAPLTMPRMENEFGQRLRAARKSAKMSIAALAERVGVSYPAAQQWETGKTFPSTENLLKLRNILAVDLTGSAQAELYDAEPNAVFEPGPVMLPVMDGPRDVEELGATMAGDAEDESAFEMNGQVVDRIKRPPGLMHRKDVFALRVTNVSMYPRFEHGERLFLEKRPAGVGEYVVIELHPREEGAPGKSYIKKLIASGAGKVTVEQFNPYGVLDFSRHEIKQMLRVIPQNELLGV